MTGYFALLFTLEVAAGCAFMCIGMLSCWKDDKIAAKRVEPIPFKKAA